MAVVTAAAAVTTVAVFYVFIPAPKFANLFLFFWPVFGLSSIAVSSARLFQLLVSRFPLLLFFAIGKFSVQLALWLRRVFAYRVFLLDLFCPLLSFRRATFTLGGSVLGRHFGTRLDRFRVRVRSVILWSRVACTTTPSAYRRIYKFFYRNSRHSLLYSWVCCDRVFLRLQIFRVRYRILVQWASKNCHTQSIQVNVYL